MKYILFLVLLTFIICSPFGIERRQKMKEKMDKLKTCVKEGGSESLKKLVLDYEGFSIDDYVRKNEISLTIEDLELYKDCRKKSNY